MVLEQITGCRVAIFDKTGTLTYGHPKLTELVVAPEFDRRQVLRLVASLEKYSKHPLAGAVLDAATAEKIELAQVVNVSEKPGQGLQGTNRWPKSSSNESQTSHCPKHFWRGSHATVERRT